MEGQSGLRHPLRTEVRMVVHTKAGIEGQPGSDVLPEIHITGHFMLRDIHDVLAFSVTLPGHIPVPCRTAETVPVHSGCQAVAPEKPHALICGYTHHVIVGIETVVQWSLAFRRHVAVVDKVVAPVVEHAQGA